MNNLKNTFSIEDLKSGKSFVLSSSLGSALQDRHFNVTSSIESDNVMIMSCNSGITLKNLLNNNRDLLTCVKKQTSLQEPVKLVLANNGELLATVEYPAPDNDVKKLTDLFEKEKSVLIRFLALLDNTEKTKKPAITVDSSSIRNADLAIEENLSAYKPGKSLNKWSMNVNVQEGIGQTVKLTLNKKQKRIEINTLLCEIAVTDKQSLMAILIFLLHTIQRCRFCRINLSKSKKNVWAVKLQILLWWEFFKIFTPHMAVQALISATGICKPVVMALKNRALANHYLNQGINRLLLNNYHSSFN